MKNSSTVSVSILAVLLLAGCAGSGETAVSDPAGQSRQEACELVQDALAEIAPITEADTSSPVAKLIALHALKDALPGLQTTAEQVTNAEIKPTVDAAVSDVSEFIDLADALVTGAPGSDAAELSDHTEALAVRVLELKEVCE